MGQLLRPDIQFSIYSFARFCTHAKQGHGEAIEHIARYLKGTADLGITLHPKQDQGFRVYADADFADNQLNKYAEFDPTTAKSRLGWVITYANCSILWASDWQS